MGSNVKCPKCKYGYLVFRLARHCYVCNNCEYELKIDGDTGIIFLGPAGRSVSNIKHFRRSSSGNSVFHKKYGMNFSEASMARFGVIEVSHKKQKRLLKRFINGKNNRKGLDYL